MYLKRLKKSIILITLCTIMMGCTYNGSVTEMETMESPGVPQDLDKDQIKEEPASQFISDESIGKQSIVNEICFDRMPLNICYVGEGELMLLGNQVALIDGNSLEIKKNSKDLEGFTFHDFWNCEVVVCEDGYIIIGIRFVPEESRTYLTRVLLDHDLNIEQVMDLEEEVGATHDIMAYKLFDSGNKLLFSTMEGFYLYDFIEKKQELLIDDSMLIYFCGILADSRQIIFTGTENGSNHSHSQILGRMELDGSGLKKEGETHLWGEIWSFSDFAFIEETESVGKECERMVFHYGKDGEIRAYPYSDIDEMYYIYPSDKGGYYATFTRINNESYVVRLYSGEDGYLVREIPMSFKEHENEMYIYKVSICEADGKIIAVVAAEEWDSHKGYLISMEL